MDHSEAWLPAGITKAALHSAIKSSGFPPQIEVSNSLKDVLAQDFLFVQEEWSYIDSDTQEVRTIDLFSQSYLFSPTETKPTVRPSLNLLIECKRSELPYVFFLTADSHSPITFPSVVGLKSENVALKTNRDKSTFNYPISLVLSLGGAPFVRDCPGHSFTFSRASRKGKGLALTGSDAYQSIVLPLLKAVDYFASIEAPSDSQVYFDAHLAIPVAV